VLLPPMTWIYGVQSMGVLDVKVGDSHRRRHRSGMCPACCSCWARKWLVNDLGGSLRGGSRRVRPMQLAPRPRTSARAAERPSGTPTAYPTSKRFAAMVISRAKDPSAGWMR